VLLAIGLAIIILWLLGNLAFHLTVGLVHILPIIGPGSDFNAFPAARRSGKLTRRVSGVN
jgi:hypothetical protein